MVSNVNMRASALLAAGVIATLVSTVTSFSWSTNIPSAIQGSGMFRRDSGVSPMQARGLSACGPVLAPRRAAAGCRLGRVVDGMNVRMADSKQEDQGKSKGKSVLVISWFYAEPKQIELVKRIYKKKGFTDVVVQESPVYEISTPRGWYKTFIGFVKSMETLKKEQTLARHFDVVHCMSGGFLNLYLILSAKIPVQFDNLVMDSTPIMPKPEAFVRFARAYFNDNGLKVITQIVPEKLHVGYQTLRWSVGASYVRLKHKAFIKKELKSLDPETFQTSNDWSRWAARSSAKSNYKDIVEDAINTVFNRPGIKTAFIYNENDAYINPADVKYVIAKCKEFGVDTTEVLTETKHIETIFRKPNVLFNAIDEMMGSQAASS